MRFVIYIFLSITFLSSCKNESKYPYAIKDFSVTIQPYLNEMVTSGWVRGYGRAVDMCDSLISEKDLEKLTLSEHPLLRAEALEIMANRKGNDYTELFMSHLGDTAMITIDDGEFGYGHRMVSDYMLERVEWKSEKDRVKAVEKAVREHNYLVKAYDVILELSPQEKYYNIIKQMAQRNRPFYELEYAILSLARYKKKGDIEMIRNILLEHTWEMGNLSFWLLKEFPNDAYWEVLLKYAKYYYMHNFNNDYSASEEFIKLLASYKSDSSAIILASIKEKLNSDKFSDKRTITYQKDVLYGAIWKNQCVAYSKLVREIKPYMIEREKKFVNESILTNDALSDFNSNRNSVGGNEKGGRFIRWRYHYYWH